MLGACWVDSPLAGRRVPCRLQQPPGVGSWGGAYPKQVPVLPKTYFISYRLRESQVYHSRCVSCHVRANAREIYIHFHFYCQSLESVARSQSACYAEYIDRNNLVLR